MTEAVADAKPRNFIQQIIDRDNQLGTYNGRVLTRFPPEPNGYLHIGHAKSICLNFGLALEYRGACNLRFDDTNPVKEDIEYMNSIIEDVSWLGFKWDGAIRNASDYFEEFYSCAQRLIKAGLAYVCDLDAEQVRQYRGTLTEPGKNSPFRERSVEENLDLFARMRAGEFPDGARTLRAKIDMASPNMNMRDPAVYRIRKAHHHRTGDAWCIYPMYDFAHCLSDAIEGITHSICTLEFQDHRPLYDWFVDHLFPKPRPYQHEFARLNMDYSVTSKRKLKSLVDEKRVNGWDDPRMLTLAGMRRRGYTPKAIRDFCERIGVAKKEGVIDMTILEDSLRDELNVSAKRVMAVLDPIKVVITTYPEGKSEKLLAHNHPQNPDMGQREISFSREIYIDRDDFMENPVPKYFRLAPGREVRLRYSYIIRCNEVIKDANGAIKELHCSYDEASLGVNPTDRKVKGTIHWVDAKTAVDAEVNLYDRLFAVKDPTAGEKDGVDFKTHLNPNSLQVISNAKLESSLAKAHQGESFQFERLGYFCLDKGAKADRLIFNRSVTLRDSWALQGSGG